jgi:hypothetical protein
MNIFGDDPRDRKVCAAIIGGGILLTIALCVGGNYLAEQDKQRCRDLGYPGYYSPPRSIRYLCLDVEHRVVVP